MGALVSTRNEGRVRSDAIDREIQVESRNRCRKVDMLLLGTDPERSMIVRRMKIQHGLTNDELLRYRLTIYEDSLNCAQALVRSMQDTEIEYANPLNHVRANQVLDYRIEHSHSFVFSAEIAEAIHGLWRDATVIDRCSEFRLGERAEYFFKEIARIGSPDYIPIDDDILRAPRCLSRLTETRFNFGAFEVTIMETARGSAAKWIHHFENITYVILCVSLGDYDLVLAEESQLNVSLINFDSITRSRWLPRTSVILLLTNVDVFEGKLSKVPLQKYFTDYTGGPDLNKAIEYVKFRFTHINRMERPIHFIQHQATNTTIDSIARIVKDAIPEDILKDSREAPSCAAVLHVLHRRPTVSPAILKSKVASFLDYLVACNQLMWTMPTNDLGAGAKQLNL